MFQEPFIPARAARQFGLESTTRSRGRPKKSLLTPFAGRSVQGANCLSVRGTEISRNDQQQRPSVSNKWHLCQHLRWRDRAFYLGMARGDSRHSSSPVGPDLYPSIVTLRVFSHLQSHSAESIAGGVRSEVSKRQAALATANTVMNCLRRGDHLLCRQA